MKAKELIKLLTEYEDFDAELKVHIAVPKEELKKRSYKYPYDTYKIELDDIGHSDKVLLLSCTIDESEA